MKVCPFCAEDIQEHQAVCPHCGSRLQAEEQSASEYVQRAGSAQGPRKMSTGKLVVIISIAILILLAGGVGGAFLILKRKNGAGQDESLEQAKNNIVAKAQEAGSTQIKSSLLNANATQAQKKYPIIGRLTEDSLKFLTDMGYVQDEGASEGNAKEIWGNDFTIDNNFIFKVFKNENEAMTHHASVASLDGTDIIALRVVGHYKDISESTTMDRLGAFLAPLFLINDNDVMAKISDFLQAATEGRVMSDGNGKYPDQVFKGVRIQL